MADWLSGLARRLLGKNHPFFDIPNLTPRQTLSFRLRLRRGHHGNRKPHVHAALVTP
jgi:hypothetical protein